MPSPFSPALPFYFRFGPPVALLSSSRLDVFIHRMSPSPSLLTRPLSQVILHSIGPCSPSPDAVFPFHSRLTWDKLILFLCLYKYLDLGLVERGGIEQVDSQFFSLHVPSFSPQSRLPSTRGTNKHSYIRRRQNPQALCQAHSTFGTRARSLSA